MSLTLNGSDLALVQQSVDRAIAVRQECSRLPVFVRQRALRFAAASVRARDEEFAIAIATHGIKTIREARSEVGRCIQTLELASGECGLQGGEAFQFDQSPQGVGRTGWWSRRSLGLVVAITPYNDPLNLVAHKVAPAIVTGSPIIIKPHPRTPQLARMLAEAFRGGGLPDDMIQIVEGTSGQAIALAEDKRVAVVSFTGGRVGGQAVAIAAAGKRLIMELGGVCSSMVASDADPERAAEALVKGITAAAGQNCVHTQVIEAAAEVYQKLVDRLCSGLASLTMGPKLEESSDVGPLVDEAHACRVEQLIQSAIQGGGRVLCGGTREGAFIRPTLIADVPTTHSLVRDEVFGPVAIIRKYDTPSEAIDRIRSAGPTINASVFTQRLDLILRFRDEIDAGTIVVNDSTDFRIDAMPFGGNGQSGLGREGIRYAAEAMTEPQLVCLRP
ncbi:MAG: aldehyde dehydrogenase family protein [Pseudomonadota bacterium]